MLKDGNGRWVNCGFYFFKALIVEGGGGVNYYFSFFILLMFVIFLLGLHLKGGGWGRGFYFFSF